MGLTPKENYLNEINHKETEWTPVHIVGCGVLGFGALPEPWFEKGPLGGENDGFDTNGTPGSADASLETRLAEVHCCFDEYSKQPGSG